MAAGENYMLAEMVGLQYDMQESELINQLPDSNYCSETASNSAFVHMLDVMAMTHEDQLHCLQSMTQILPLNQKAADCDYLLHSPKIHPKLEAFASTSNCHSSVTFDEASSSHIQGKGAEKKKRKRSRVCKNREEVENQRMTHIAVERNRRKQMNEHLSILRSLMPGSYVQRGDQASIIGGAIEFVKELEQVLHSLQTQKSRKECSDVFVAELSPTREESLVQGDFLFCNYMADASYDGSQNIVEQSSAECRSSMAEVEVKMVGCNHATVKILSHSKPAGQLLRIVAAIESLLLTIMHLNISTIDQTVLYSLSVKMEMDCKLHTAGELAACIQNLVDVNVKVEEY